MHPLLQNSFGTRPQILQEDTFPEGIVGMSFASEARTLLIGLGNGTLILLDQTGKQLKRERGFDGLTHLVWSEDARFGAAALKNGKVVCFDATLKIQWNVELTGSVLGLAMAPFGSHIAVCSESARTHIVTSDKKEVGRFDTPRPLKFVQFVHETACVIGAAEFGHLCCHRLDGKEEWNERIVNNVGNLSVSVCVKRILLSAFNHGIQVLNSKGKQTGSFMLEGIPNYAVIASSRRRVAATSLENRVYWLNNEGDIKWAGDLSKDPVHLLALSALGDRLFLATNSGRLLQLMW